MSLNFNMHSYPPSAQTKDRNTFKFQTPFLSSMVALLLFKCQSYFYILQQNYSEDEITLAIIASCTPLI